MQSMLRISASLAAVVLMCVYTASGYAQELFSHDSYTVVLDTYVDDIGMVDYSGLRDDRDGLDAYVHSLGTLSGDIYDRMDEPEQIAFWINAYNALTLTAIIDHYPIRASLFKSLLYPKNSIRQISGVWDKLAFTVMGADITLNHIEHEILRVRFDEPRIHLALVCAAMGCPHLRNEAYVGARLHEQLDDQVRRFITNPEKFRIDHARGTVSLSSIFKWYGDDFIASYGTDREFTGNDRERAVLQFHSMYLDSVDETFLRDDTYTITYLDYDWSLNERD